MYQDTAKINISQSSEVPQSFSDKEKIIAVRLKKISDGDRAFMPSEAHKNKRKLVGSRVERRDPALRNLSEGLENKGLQMIVDGCALYWFQIEDDNTLEYYQRMNEVECVFSVDWFDDFKKGIRYFQGAQYVEKCLMLANQFEIKDQSRSINYSL